MQYQKGWSRFACRAAFVALTAAGLGAVGTAQAAPFATIEGLTFDLGQFAGASVTTNVSDGDIFGSTFDNANGIDLFTLGELATGQFGFDPGDRISLGINDGDQDMLTLTYGMPVVIGSGDASLFAVYEQSGDANLDPEGTNFEISFNGNAFVDASVSGSVTATGGVVGGGGTEQNQILFDLLHPDFGFSVGQTLSTVTIRNLVILGSGEDDPDFLFAARAGEVSAVPVPAALPLAATGMALLGVLGWRRHGASA